jgi:hypothetical protein
MGLVCPFMLVLFGEEYRTFYFNSLCIRVAFASILLCIRVDFAGILSSEDGY